MSIKVPSLSLNLNNKNESISKNISRDKDLTILEKEGIKELEDDDEEEEERDYSYLDYKTIEDFLNKYLTYNSLTPINSPIKTKTKPSQLKTTNTTNQQRNDRLLLDLTHQLKITRNLLSLSIAIQTITKKDILIQKFIDCTRALIDVEKVFFFEVKNENILLKTHLNSSESYQVQFGVECKSSFLLTLLSFFLIFLNSLLFCCSSCCSLLIR